jgi:hypothetical protein
MGFKTDMYEISNKRLKRERLSSKLGWLDRQFMKLKYWTNILNVMDTLSWDNFLDFKPP